MRKSSSMKRIQKGDFFRIDGELFVALGFAERISDTKVRVPVRKCGSVRPSRRQFQANHRVNIW